MLTISEMNAAFEAAKNEVRRAEISLQENATLMAKLLVGRLQFVEIPEYNFHKDTLALLKRELQNYNTKTKKWVGQ